MTPPKQNLTGLMRDKAVLLWHVQRVKTLVRQHLGSATACMVSVSELLCADPECQGIATEIWIVSADLMQWRVRVHKPVAGVDDGDVLEALAVLQ